MALTQQQLQQLTDEEKKQKAAFEKQAQIQNWEGQHIIATAMRARLNVRDWQLITEEEELKRLAEIDKANQLLGRAPPPGIGNRVNPDDLFHFFKPGVYKNINHKNFHLVVDENGMIRPTPGASFKEAYGVIFDMLICRGLTGGTIYINQEPGDGMMGKEEIKILLDLARERGVAIQFSPSVQKIINKLDVGDQIEISGIQSALQANAQRIQTILDVHSTDLKKNVDLLEKQSRELTDPPQGQQPLAGPAYRQKFVPQAGFDPSQLNQQGQPQANNGGQRITKDDITKIQKEVADLKKRAATAKAMREALEKNLETKKGVLNGTINLKAADIPDKFKPWKETRRFFKKRKELATVDEVKLVTEANLKEAPDRARLIAALDNEDAEIKARMQELSGAALDVSNAINAATPGNHASIPDQTTLDDLKKIAKQTLDEVSNDPQTNAPRPGSLQDLSLTMLGDNASWIATKQFCGIIPLAPPAPPAPVQPAPVQPAPVQQPAQGGAPAQPQPVQPLAQPQQPPQGGLPPQQPVQPVQPQQPQGGAPAQQGGAPAQPAQQPAQPEFTLDKMIETAKGKQDALKQQQKKLGLA